MTVRVDAGGHGALCNISGVVSNSATWNQSIFFYEGGAALDISGLSFELQFRGCSDDTSGQVTLSTAAGDLTISSVLGGISNVLRIDVPYTRISGLVGDYIADLVSKDADDELIHWGHGVMTFRQDPVVFSS